MRYTEARELIAEALGVMEQIVFRPIGTGYDFRDVPDLLRQHNEKMKKDPFTTNPTIIRNYRDISRGGRYGVIPQNSRTPTNDTITTPPGRKPESILPPPGVSPYMPHHLPDQFPPDFSKRGGRPNSVTNKTRSKK
jgi:hypothetical protein